MFVKLSCNGNFEENIDLSHIHLAVTLPIRDSDHGRDMAPFIGDLSQREKLSEIKSPLKGS